MNTTKLLEELFTEPLPSQWCYAVTRDGRVFFVDEEMQVTTWLHPMYGIPVQSGHFADPDLPAGWEKDFMVPSGKPYYINHSTQQTSLEKPTVSLVIDVENPNASQHDKTKLSEFKRSTSRRRTGKKVIEKIPVIKRNPTAKVILKGWLYKQEPSTLKAWKKRWCVLAELCLFHYKGSDEGDCIGSTLLPGYSISACAKDDDGITRKFAFKIEHTNIRTLFFAAETMKDMEMWIKVLTQATTADVPARDKNESDITWSRSHIRSRSHDDLDRKPLQLDHPDLLPVAGSNITRGRSRDNLMSSSPSQTRRHTVSSSVQQRRSVDDVDAHWVSSYGAAATVRDADYDRIQPAGDSSTIPHRTVENLPSTEPKIRNSGSNYSRGGHSGHSVDDFVDVSALNAAAGNQFVAHNAKSRDIINWLEKHTSDDEERSNLQQQAAVEYDALKGDPRLENVSSQITVGAELRHQVPASKVENAPYDQGQDVRRPENVTISSGNQIGFLRRHQNVPSSPNDDRDQQQYGKRMEYQQKLLRSSLGKDFSDQNFGSDNSQTHNGTRNSDQLDFSQSDSSNSRRPIAATNFVNSPTGDEFDRRINRDAVPLSKPVETPSREAGQRTNYDARLLSDSRQSTDSYETKPPPPRPPRTDFSQPSNVAGNAANVERAAAAAAVVMQYETTRGSKPDVILNQRQTAPGIRPSPGGGSHIKIDENCEYAVVQKRPKPVLDTADSAHERSGISRPKMAGFVRQPPDGTVDFAEQADYRLSAQTMHGPARSDGTNGCLNDADRLPPGSPQQQQREFLPNAGDEYRSARDLPNQKHRAQLAESELLLVRHQMLRTEITAATISETDKEEIVKRLISIRRSLARLEENRYWLITLSLQTPQRETIGSNVACAADDEDLNRQLAELEAEIGLTASVVGQLEEQLTGRRVASKTLSDGVRQTTAAWHRQSAGHQLSTAIDTREGEPDVKVRDVVGRQSSVQDSQFDNTVIDVKLSQLQQLQRAIDDQSIKINRLRDDKTYLMKAVFKAQKDEDDELDGQQRMKLRQQRQTLDRELFSCQRQLADETKTLEDLTARSSKLEAEVAALDGVTYDVIKSSTTTQQQQQHQGLDVSSSSHSTTSSSRSRSNRFQQQQQQDDTTERRPLRNYPSAEPTEINCYLETDLDTGQCRNLACNVDYPREFKVSSAPHDYPVKREFAAPIVSVAFNPTRRRLGSSDVNVLLPRLSTADDDVSLRTGGGGERDVAVESSGRPLWTTLGRPGLRGDDVGSRSQNGARHGVDQRVPVSDDLSMLSIGGRYIEGSQVNDATKNGQSALSSARRMLSGTDDLESKCDTGHQSSHLGTSGANGVINSEKTFSTGPANRYSGLNSYPQMPLKQDLVNSQDHRPYERARSQIPRDVTRTQRGVITSSNENARSKSVPRDAQARSTPAVIASRTALSDDEDDDENQDPRRGRRRVSGVYTARPFISTRTALIADNLINHSGVMAAKADGDNAAHHLRSPTKTEFEPGTVGSNHNSDQRGNIIYRGDDRPSHFTASDRQTYGVNHDVKSAVNHDRVQLQDYRSMIAAQSQLRFGGQDLTPQSNAVHLRSNDNWQQLPQQSVYWRHPQSGPSQRVQHGTAEQQQLSKQFISKKMLSGDDDGSSL